MNAEDIKRLETGFLLEKKDYGNDLRNFINYFEKQTPTPFYAEVTLRGINVDEIIKSLKHYVEIGQIKKKEPARKYCSAVGQWFEFLFENSDLSNPDLKNALGAPPTRKESYSYCCKDYIDNCDLLKEKETYPPLTNEQAAALLKWANDAIDAGIQNPEKDAAFKRMACALCIKLMLFAGITYRVARAIEFKNYSEEEGTLTINSYIIRLPLRLTCELRKYKQICKERKFDIKDGTLFMSATGEQWGEKTVHSGITGYLNSQLESNSVNSVVKYGVQQLLSQGVSDSVILNLTGVRRELLQDCVEPGQDNKKWIFSYINSKLIKHPLYWEL